MNTQKRTLLPTIVLVLALCLLFAACGGGFLDDSPSAGDLEESVFGPEDNPGDSLPPEP